jgi:NADH-quinone oxidoreductase subunit C
MAADQALFDQLRQRFGVRVVKLEPGPVDPWVEVTADGLAEICRYLRDAPALRYDMINCITGVDYLHTDPKKAAKVEWQPHLSVVYHLSSTVTRQQLVVKVTTSRWKDDVEGQLPEVPSVSGIWHGANWHEREVYDLIGVQFTGHPDLRRILCPEDWVGHPLRKDYQPPEYYHGIRDH